MNGRSPNISLGHHEHELQQRIKAAEDERNVWYNAIASDVQEQNALRQERLLHAKHERDRIAEAERQEHERIERSQLEARRRRLAEQVEQRRIENERLQREREEAQAARLTQIVAEEAERQRRLADEAERQRVEDERRRRERDEAQAAHLARLAAEEDRRRRQAEQAERIRRERLRECAVCFDSQDMDLMVQVECSHWYCIEDIRSMYTLCRFIGPELINCVADAFEIAWTSRNPFQCCQHVISPDSLSEVFSQHFRAQYGLWLMERTTPNPVYCSNRNCGRFLPRSQASGAGRDSMS